MIWQVSDKIYAKVDMDQDAFLRHNGKWSEMRQCWIFDAAQYTMEDLAQILNVPIIPTLKPEASKPQVSKPQSTSSAKKLAAKLESLAATAEKNAKAKRSSAIFNQRPTARRMSIGASIAADAAKLEEFAQACRALAEAHRNGTIPEALKHISTKAQIESTLATKEALKQLMAAQGQTKHDSTEEIIKEKIRDLFGVAIEGFFPTPQAIVELMLDRADLQAHHSVLEPSAGFGSITDEILKRYPSIQLDVCEINHRLCEILRLKRLNIVRDDFLRMPIEGKYDRILMNPPFTIKGDSGAYIDHILHAFACLKTGGKIIAIAPPNFEYRRERRFEAFRQFLKANGVYESLPESSFKGSFNSTTVRTVLLTIFK